MVLRRWFVVMYELGIGARLRLVVVKYGRMNVMARPRLASGNGLKRELVVWASKGM